MESMEQNVFIASEIANDVNNVNINLHYNDKYSYVSSLFTYKAKIENINETLVAAFMNSTEPMMPVVMTISPIAAEEFANSA
ncbi:hypothetical protein FQR65_LT10170 [Abscondita terminalis]|nr:hypothetical protein FQR65_LT10170 [Abscondita terminalis]